MTIRQALNFGSGELEHASTSPVLDSEVLLSWALNRDKNYLFANPEKILSPSLADCYKNLIAKRKTGMPVAYLTGRKDFFGLDFIVTPDVLIPRPETETLVEEVLKILKKIKKPVATLDIGTGSGAIIVSLAKKLKNNNTYFASDISEKALRIARQNAKKHRVKITFRQGSLLKPWKTKRFDVIMANLPYGWKQWKNNTSAQTVGLKFEPQEALFTSEQGLLLIKNLMQEIGERSKKPQLLALEFDPRQSREIKKLAKLYLPEFNLRICSDLAGKHRVGLFIPKSS
jgi:release factor glutamine methyltransferase